jgi:NitT/TauT family transport system permease protein
MERRIYSEGSIRNRRGRFLEPVGWILSIFTMLLLWSLLSFMNREIVPDPISSFAYMLQLKSYDLIENISITLANSVEGFLIALLLSMLLLSASHASSIVKSIINSMNTVLQSVSVLVWTIIFVLIFGVLSRMPSILVTAVTVLPVMLSNLVTSLENVDKRYLEMVRMLGANWKQELVEVVIPSSIPYLISASRAGFGLALRISVVAEAFGSNGGIGFMIIHSYNLMDTKGVFSWSLVLVILMIAIDQLVLRPAERYMMRWRI